MTFKLKSDQKPDHERSLSDVYVNIDFPYCETLNKYQSCVLDFYISGGCRVSEDSPPAAVFKNSPNSGYIVE